MLRLKFWQKFFFMIHDYTLGLKSPQGQLVYSSDAHVHIAAFFYSKIIQLTIELQLMKTITSYNLFILSDLIFRKACTGYCI